MGVIGRIYFKGLLEEFHEVIPYRALPLTRIRPDKQRSVFKTVI